MVANLASVVRITTRQSAVWKHCPGCDALAPLAPDRTRCPDCTHPTSRATARTRRAAPGSRSIGCQAQYGLVHASRRLPPNR